MFKIHLKTAWDYARRSPIQAMAAVFVLAITFFVTTVIAVLVYSSNQAIKYFETKPQVIAFLKDDVQVADISDLQKRLVEDPRLKEVKYVSKEDALEIYKEATSDNPLLSELVSPDIFPASLEFSLTDLAFAEGVIDDVKNQEIVEEVGFTANLGGEATLTDVVGRLRTITWYLRIGGIAFVSVLMGASFLILLIIISMRMSVRKGEIEILDLIGATPGFIRSPILLEALMYSFFGVLAGWFLALILVLYTTPTIISYFGEIPVLPKDTMELLKIEGVILAGELAIGIVLALTGSMIAVSRARKRK